MDPQQGLNEWLTSTSVDPETKKYLETLSEEKVAQYFGHCLEFGTGGVRAELGPGYNRLNKYVIRWITQAFANYFLKRNVQRGAKIAIAYDTRWNSWEFAWEIARVFAANGFKVYLFLEPTPTPMLSFAVRDLEAVGGVVVTASHNPPQYNGYKAYISKGVQAPVEVTEEILAESQKLDFFKDVKYLFAEEARESNLINWVPQSTLTKYYSGVNNFINSLNFTRSGTKPIKVIYTPLHGTGLYPVQKALKDLNIPLVLLEEQSSPDPRFGNIDYPNPEDQKSLALAKEEGLKSNADIIIATDPDCDRIGLAVLDKSGEYIDINGNQIGALLTEFLLGARHSNNSILPGSFIVKSVVTSKMVNRIAKKYGVRTYDTLIGFKFIGGLAEEQQEKLPGRFLFAFEESNGYLAGDLSRDKDGVLATALTCHMASYYKGLGLTLVDRLEELLMEHGYFLEGLLTVNLARDAQKELMAEIRKKPPIDIAGLIVTDVIDYINGYEDTTASVIKPLPPTNLLQFICGERAIVSIRPSGTEPKVKVYISVCADNREEAQRLLKECEEAMDNFLGNHINN